jgi:hypothetical protein
MLHGEQDYFYFWYLNKYKKKRVKIKKKNYLGIYDDGGWNIGFCGNIYM